MKKLIVLVLLLVGCSSAPETITVEETVEVPVTVVVTELAEVTRVVEKEITRVVEVEKEVTRVVERVVTATPRPTPTPEPTPAIELEAMTFTGSGDSIVDVEKPEEPAIVHIVGNAGGRFFAVSNLDSNNESIDLLVNTTEPYDGIRPLDFLEDEQTVRFEVQATGEWTIEILPLTEARIVSVPGTIEGTGDDVVIVVGDGDTADISGNASGRFFAVIAYSNRANLLVNVTDPYEGRVIMPANTSLLEIVARDDWSITINE